MCACTEPVRTGIGAVCVEYGRPKWPITTLNHTHNHTHTYIKMFCFLFERSEFLIATSKKKKTVRLPVCTRVRLILVLVCGIMYHIRTYLVSARYQPATKIRILIYVCARVGYVLCATYVKIVFVLCRVPASAWYQRKKKRTPGTSERFVANCGVGPSARGQGDSASLVKPTQDQRR